MRILITGAGGFIGQALLRHVTAEYPTAEISLLSSTGHKDFPTIVYGRDGGSYFFDIDGYYDVVLHLGAWTPKTASEGNNIAGSCSNVAFTEQLLNMLSGRVGRLIFASTLDVYAAESNRINEQSAISPISLYGDSKFFCEHVVAEWCRQQGVQSCILRLGHIYGEGEGAYKKMIPVWITNALAGRPIVIFSDGMELRSFLYIGDCVKYIGQAVMHPEIEGTYNIASGNPYHIKDIAAIIKDITGGRSEIVIKGGDIPGRSLTFDIHKLRAAFDVHETDIRTGLEAEVNYFRQING